MPLNGIETDGVCVRACVRACRRTMGATGASWLELPDLLVALIHVAHARHAAESDSLGMPADATLAQQFSSLLHVSERHPQCTTLLRC